MKRHIYNWYYEFPSGRRSVNSWFIDYDDDKLYHHSDLKRRIQAVSHRLDGRHQPLFMIATVDGMVLWKRGQKALL